MSNAEFYDLLRMCREYCLKHGPIDAADAERTSCFHDDKDGVVLQELVSVWRRNGSPPTGKELGSALVAKIKRRYGTLVRARELAKGKLTEEERWRLGWRCRYCKKGGFTSASGRGTHERACKVRKERESR